MSEPNPSRTLTLEDFVPRVETVFTAVCAPRDVPLTLVEAYALKNHARSDRVPFLLIFRSNSLSLLREGSYSLRADGFAASAIDLIPTARGPGAAPGYYYQAVFG